MKRFIIALCFLSAPSLAQQPQMPDLEEIFFKQFDANQDGQVSKEEFLKPTEAQFDHMDSDQNGALNQAEIKAFNEEMTQRMQEMQRRMQEQQQGMPRR